MLKGIEEIEGLTPEQVEAINGLAGGIVNKNIELLDKLQKAKDNGTASASELAALKEFKENAELKEAEAAQNWESAKAQMTERHQKEIDDLKGENSKQASIIEDLVVGKGLSDALDGVKVNPSLKAGAEAMLRGKVEIVEGKAQVGDQSLSDYINEWSNSDEGKSFCLASENSGGNGNGGSGGNTPNPTSKDYSKMSRQERVKYLETKT